MSNARNLANLLGTNSTIQTAKIADAAVTNAKLENNISVDGTLTVTGATTLSSTLGVAGDSTFTGTTPTLTIGDGGAEDAKIIFDGNDYDFHFGLDDSADKLTIGRGSALGTTTSMTIDQEGNILKPLQPCFSIKKSGAQNNITAGGAAVTVTFDTEIFDQGGDFASNTFTAPVTGRYKIQYTITVVQIDLDASEYNFRLASSNRNYSNALSPTPFDADTGNYPIVGTYMVDMDANDTVFLQIVCDGGSQLDVAADSYFSGFLVA